MTGTIVQRRPPLPERLRALSADASAIARELDQDSAQRGRLARLASGLSELAQQEGRRAAAAREQRVEAGRARGRQRQEQEQRPYDQALVLARGLRIANPYVSKIEIARRIKEAFSLKMPAVISISKYLGRAETAGQLPPRVTAESLRRDPLVRAILDREAKNDR